MVASASLRASPPALVCLGCVAGAHGVRGALKVKSFCQVPADIFLYGPLHMEDQTSVLTLTLQREVKAGLFIAGAVEVKNREAALAWKGKKLFVERSALPPPAEDEFYYDDLVGLSAVTVTGAPFGRVKAVVNYGAGDLLELYHVPDHQGIILIPFTKIMVPHINMHDRCLHVVPPERSDDGKSRAKNTSR